MKKFLASLLAVAMMVSLTACSKEEEVKEPETEEKQEEEVKDVVSAYNITNNAGSKVTELYVYLSGSEDKGPNYAGEEGMEVEAMVTIDETVNDIFKTVKSNEEAAKEQFILEFVCEDGTTGSFTTLAREEANISLLSVDGRTGPTEIAFTF